MTSYYDRFPSKMIHKGVPIDMVVGNIDFDLAVINSAITKSDTHAVVPPSWDARPDLVAFELFRNSSMWWLILMSNNIKDPFEFKGNTLIKVPNLI